MNIALTRVSLAYHPNGRPPLRVFRDISFDVAGGEIVCLLGPSGCGKTTILKLIAGLLAPTAGEIRFVEDGSIVSRPRIGFMFQRDLLFPWLTVIRNVMLCADVRGERTSELGGLAMDKLVSYGLGDFAHAYPGELSGGMRQRVALIRSMLSDNAAMLLDEPLGSIDYAVRLRIEEDLFHLARTRKIPTVLVTHDIESAVAIGDRILIMSQCPSSIETVFTPDRTAGDVGPLAFREAGGFGSDFAAVLRAFRRASL